MLSKGIEWLKKVLDRGVWKVVEEFNKLEDWIPGEESTYGASNENQDKLRYWNVPCQDQGSVVLRFPGINSGFIHANYVSKQSDKNQIICTQGPLKKTQHAFWAMVVQESIEMVIMLCQTLEKNHHYEQCSQYYPKEVGETMTFGDGDHIIKVATIKSKAMEEEPEIQETLLKVEALGKELIVRHLQWVTWPDYGVPERTAPGRTLLKEMETHNKPTIVHCSAGIGRTGTVVACFLAMERLKRGQSLEMEEVLKDLRRQRPLAIQGAMQYLFAHRLIMDYLQEEGKVAYEGGEMKGKMDEWNKSLRKLSK